MYISQHDYPRHANQLPKYHDELFVCVYSTLMDDVHVCECVLTCESRTSLFPSILPIHINVLQQHMYLLFICFGKQNQYFRCKLSLNPSAHNGVHIYIFQYIQQKYKLVTSIKPCNNGIISLFRSYSLSFLHIQVRFSFSARSLLLNCASYTAASLDNAMRFEFSFQTHRTGTNLPCVHCIQINIFTI